MPIFKLFGTVCLGASLFIGCSFDLSQHIAAEPDSVVTQYHAVRLFEQGDLDGALKLLDKSIEKCPDSVALYLIRGTILRKSGDYTRAIADFDRAIQLEPSSADAHCQRGFAYSQSEIANWDDNAMTDATTALELDPTNALAHIVRGNAYAERQEYDAAIADFSRAIELNPSSCSAYGNRARAHYCLGDVSQARQDIATALSLDPSPVDRPALEAFSEYLEDSDRTLPAGLLNR